MSFYSRHVFPWVLDHAMRRPAIAAQRPFVLAEARGDVLEIGFGTGLNVPHYPPGVRRLSVVEPNEASLRRAGPRIVAGGLEVTPVPLVAGRDVGAAGESFDTIVSTWTLCTIPDPAHALREVYRLLRPGGRFLFVEHGLAPDAGVARWQRRLNPINRLLGDGCNLDRDIAALLDASPLSVDSCDRFYLEQTPKLGGYTYRGSANR